jgi:hypothetical protein
MAGAVRSSLSQANPRNYGVRQQANRTLVPVHPELGSIPTHTFNYAGPQPPIAGQPHIGQPTSGAPNAAQRYGRPPHALPNQRSAAENSDTDAMLGEDEDGAGRPLETESARNTPVKPRCRPTLHSPVLTTVSAVTESCAPALLFTCSLARQRAARPQRSHFLFRGPAGPPSYPHFR